MLNAARWAVLGLLAVSILVLSFTLGYVFNNDDSASGSEPKRKCDVDDLSTDRVGDWDVALLGQIVELGGDR